MRNNLISENKRKKKHQSRDLEKKRKVTQCGTKEGSANTTPQVCRGISCLLVADSHQQSGRATVKFEAGSSYGEGDKGMSENSAHC